MTDQDGARGTLVELRERGAQWEPKSWRAEVEPGGLSCLGRAGARDTRGRSTPQSIVRGGAKGKRRWAKELAVFRRGGGRGRLGGISGDTADLEMSGTSGDETRYSAC